MLNHHPLGLVSIGLMELEIMALVVLVPIPVPIPIPMPRFTNGQLSTLDT